MNKECKQKQSRMFNFCNISDLLTSGTQKIAWWHPVFKPDFDIFSYNEQLRKIWRNIINKFLLYHTSLIFMENLFHRTSSIYFWQDFNYVCNRWVCYTSLVITAKLQSLKNCVKIFRINSELSIVINKVYVLQIICCNIVMVIDTSINKIFKRLYSWFDQVLFMS